MFINYQPMPPSNQDWDASYVPDEGDMPVDDSFTIDGVPIEDKPKDLNLITVWQIERKDSEGVWQAVKPPTLNRSYAVWQITDLRLPNIDNYRLVETDYLPVAIRHLEKD